MSSDRSPELKMAQVFYFVRSFIYLTSTKIIQFIDLGIKRPRPEGLLFCIDSYKEKLTNSSCPKLEGPGLLNLICSFI